MTRSTDDGRDWLGSRIENEFSGEASAVVQTGPFFGDLHVQLPSITSMPVPRQLPLPSRHFVNRAESLEKLDALLLKLAGSGRKGAAAVVISAVSGAAGIGKTALALCWAHKVRHRFPDGDLFADLRGYDQLAPVHPQRVLEHFLRSMNVPATHIPSDLDSTAALYRSILAERRLLIVLDNASSPDQIRPLLPGSPSSMVIVTSRNRLSGLAVREGAARVTLDILTAEESLALLREIIGAERVDNDLDAANRIVAFCSFLPLALRIVADRAAQRPTEPLNSLVDELATEEHLLDAFSPDDDELSAVRTVLSWSYRSLEPDAARLLRLLSEHTGPELGVPAAAALADLSEKTARRLLDSLNRIHLIERAGVDRFSIHDLVRAYAAERLAEDASTDERNEARRRVLNWYLARSYDSYRSILPQGRPIDIGSVARSMETPGFRQVKDALAWCDRERSNVLGCVSRAEDSGEYELAWKIAVSFMGYLERRSYWSDWILSHEIAIRSAHAVGDGSAEAFALMLQGDAFWDRRSFPAALERYERAIAVSRRASDRWTEGFALRGCGLTYQELAEYDQAIVYAKEALKILIDIGEMRGKGMTLLSLGNAYRGMRNLDSAISHYRKAIEVFSELGNRWSIGLANYHTGIAYAMKPEHSAALGAFFSALDLFRELGDRRHEAWVLRDMASSLTAIGSRDAAVQARRRALQIFLDLDDPQAEDLRRLLAES